MGNGYGKTMTACFVGYIVQAIVNNFIPLLFLTFHSFFEIPMTNITFLITMNFCVQLLVDLISVHFVDKIGYRCTMLLAHGASAAGLILLSILPFALSDAYTGIMISVVLYAIGGGLLEVVVSPVMEACPTSNKEAAMSLLHSFYCWGHVGVILVSTIFFSVFGISNWRILAALWALVPLVNLLAFTKVPIAKLIGEGQEKLPVRKLMSIRLFWIFLLLMICSGACEQAVSQWASTFAEKGLGISKRMGDLAGPMFFAIMMGTSRSLYGKYGDRLPLNKFMYGSVFLCLGAYLLTALSPVPALGLLGCGVCGFSVGILWPGTFSLASAAIPGGGTALFAFLALGGDIGCSAGPTLAGLVAAAFGDDLRHGILAAIIFPLLMLAGLKLKERSKKGSRTM